MTMKKSSSEDFGAILKRFAASLDTISSDSSRSSIIKTCDQLIERLQQIRNMVDDRELALNIGEILPALNKVVQFLEAARANERFSSILALAQPLKAKKRD